MTAQRKDRGEKQMHFSTSTTDGVATLRIVGELDAVTAPDLRPSVEALLAKRPARVVVDVSELRLIDSCGVGGLVLLYKKVKEYGGVVTIHGLSNQPAAIFKLLHLDRVLQA
jgi:anti-sigma B factor antagonist